MGVLGRLLECGLSWPSMWETPDWEVLIAAVESEPPGGPLHRDKDPHDWRWFVPGYHETVLQNELTAMANWQRAGGKGMRPKPAPRPWDKKKRTRKIEAREVPVAEFEEWFAGRFESPQ